MVFRSIFGDLRPETKIYRIFSQMRFFDLFEEKQNGLLRPEIWDDPFENVFLKSKVECSNGEKGEFSFRKDVYGQCWTLETESHAMWQIYSKNRDGIRVRTTVGKLIDSLRAAHGEMADVSCFIGRVKYQNESELRQFGKSMLTQYNGADAIVQSLLIKRKAYKHEKEVRLIYIAPKETKESDWVFRYNIDPLAIFDQAMIDGRVCEEEFVILKEKIAKRTGLSKRRIRRSLLYTPPKNFVVDIL